MCECVDEWGWVNVHLNMYVCELYHPNDPTKHNHRRMAHYILSSGLDSVSHEDIGNDDDDKEEGGVCLLVGCLTSQQQASVSQGRICSDNFTCCHTEIEVADPTFHLTQSQYTDTGPTSPSADPITPGAWQGSHWSANS